MVQITPAAVQQFKTLMSGERMTCAGIRIYAAPGGCCGPQFGMEITQNGEAGDQQIETDGLKFYVEPEAAKILAQAKIDYLQSGPRTGFAIQGLGSSCCG